MATLRFSSYFINIHLPQNEKKKKQIVHLLYEGSFEIEKVWRCRNKIWWWRKKLPSTKAKIGL